MGMRRLFRGVLPISRVGAALWAWRHRREIAGWTAWVARSAPRVVAGDTRDVVVEGRLRARLTGDERTHGADDLQVRVSDGVATLRGRVAPDARDAAVGIATNINGIDRVRDELDDKQARRRR